MFQCLETEIEPRLTKIVRTNTSITSFFTRKKTGENTTRSGPVVGGTNTKLQVCGLYVPDIYFAE